MTPPCRTGCWCIVLCAVALAAGRDAWARQDPSQCGQWLSAGASPGTSEYSPSDNSGALSDGTAWRDQLVAVGFFNYIGGAPAKNVARWDGRRWHALGTGLNDSAGAITVYEGDVIVGGGFTSAGGVSCARVARWNGSTWSPMGKGFTDRVYTLFNFDGELIAVGSFGLSGTTRCNGIARWDGSAWQPFGTGTNGDVWAAARFNGDLVIGGDFTEAGGVPCSRLARWDGAAWRPLSGGADAPVYALLAHQGRLYTFGEFLTIDGRPSRMAAHWDGRTWTPLHGVATDVEYLYCARVFRGEVCVGPAYYGATYSWAALVVRGNAVLPLMPHQLGPTVHGHEVYVTAMTNWRGELALLGGFRGLFVACGIEQSGRAKVVGAALYDGTALHSLEDGCPGIPGNTESSPLATAVASTGVGLYIAVNSLSRAVAPYRLVPPTCPALSYVRVALWTGFGATGTPPATFGSSPSFLLSYRDLPTAIITRQAFQIRNGAWSLLAGWGAPLPASSLTDAACIWNDLLVAAAQNTPPSGPSTIYITDGSSTTNLGSPPLKVLSLLSWRGDLIAAGSRVSTVPGDSNGVMRWTGTAWAPLGPVDPASTGDSITALATYNGDLVAAGTFTRFGTSRIGVARYDGTSWEFLGASFTASTTTTTVIRALHEYGGKLYVGGFLQSFTAAEQTRTCPNRLATWDGGRWEPVADPGTQTDAGAVYAMTTHKGELFIAGSFMLFNGVPSGGIVRYTIHPVVEVEDQPADSLTCPSGTATLTATVSGTTDLSPYTFQWQEPDPDAPDEWVDLREGPLVRGGGRIVADLAGTAGPTLALSGAADPGSSGIALRARCVISNACGSSYTLPAHVRVARFDYNCDGTVNPDDVGDFITDIFALPPVPGPGGYAALCPELGPPFDAGYRAGFTAGGQPQCTQPVADNLGDFLTAYFGG